MTVNADINKTLRTTDPAAGKVALALDLAATSGAGRSARRYYGDTLVNPHSMLFAVFALPASDPRPRKRGPKAKAKEKRIE